MKPTAAPPYFPYYHRTMAEVMADEQRRRRARRLGRAKQFGYEAEAAE